VGRLLLIYRLVVGDIRRRPVQSALLLVVIVTTTTTLTLGLTLRHVAQNPFARTRAATRGPDVVVHGQPNPGSTLQLTHAAQMQGLRTPSQAFTRLGHAAGVAAIGGRSRSRSCV
jgi:putative ABC transport system permease protein